MSLLSISRDSPSLSSSSGGKFNYSVSIFWECFVCRLVSSTALLGATLMGRWRPALLSLPFASSWGADKSILSGIIVARTGGLVVIVFVSSPLTFISTSLNSLMSFSLSCMTTDGFSWGLGTSSMGILDWLDYSPFFKGDAVYFTSEASRGIRVYRLVFDGLLLWDTRRYFGSSPFFKVS